MRYATSYLLNRGLHSDVEAVEAKVDQGMAALRSNVADLRSDVEDLGTRVDELREDVGVVGERVARIEGRLDPYQPSGAGWYEPLEDGDPQLSTW